MARESVVNEVAQLLAQAEAKTGRVVVKEKELACVMEELDTLAHRVARTQGMVARLLKPPVRKKASRVVAFRDTKPTEREVPNV